ncbi:hypothetical protein JX266_009186 [Neoarthrinium moseri]|nr:hypothetical protein JX266_009186 [Neoarthrinium moseri]
MGPNSGYQNSALESQALSGDTDARGENQRTQHGIVDASMMNTVNDEHQSDDSVSVYSIAPSSHLQRDSGTILAVKGADTSETGLQISRLMDEISSLQDQVSMLEKQAKDEAKEAEKKFHIIRSCLRSSADPLRLQSENNLLSEYKSHFESMKMDLDAITQKQALGIPNKEIEFKMNVIENEISQMSLQVFMSTSEPRAVSIDPQHWHSHTQIARLMERIAPSSTWSLLSRSTCLPSSDFLRSLIAASVCVHVFDAPVFSSLMDSTLLHNFYKIIFRMTKGKFFIRTW